MTPSRQERRDEKTSSASHSADTKIPGCSEHLQLFSLVSRTYFTFNFSSLGLAVPGAEQPSESSGACERKHLTKTAQLGH